MSNTESKLDAALEWLTATPENTIAFRSRFDVIHDAVEGLSESDLETLRAIHAKGLAATQAMAQAEVIGMRDYGWAQPSQDNDQGK